MNLIVAGTLVTPSVGDLYYGSLAKELDAEVLCLAMAGLAPMERSVAKVTSRAEKSPERVTLIGHSQGGLVSTIVGLRRPDLVKRVVAIGAPLKGTPFAPWWGPSSVRAMSRDSAFVYELRSTPWSHGQVELVTIGGARDALVPLCSATDSRGRHFVLNNGHIDIINDPELSLLLRNKVLLDCP